MKAVQIRNGSGNADALYVSDVPLPENAKNLPEGYALIKVAYFALNRMDILQREGKYPPPPGTTDILGVEFSGTVEKLNIPQEEGDEGDIIVTGNESLSRVKVGDKVAGLIPGGAYAEYVVAPIEILIVVGDKYPLRDAAGLPEVWFTALQVLSLVGGLLAGENVLIHAGASGVGIAAIQIAQILKASRVYTTVGTDEKVDFVENELNLGTGTEIRAINYKKEDFAAVVGNSTIQLVIDPVGQSYFNRNLRVLGVDGRLVQLAVMSGPIVQDVNIGQLIPKRLSILGTNLRGRTVQYQSRLRHRFEVLLFPKLVSGELKAFVEREFPIEQIADAHKLLESNTTKGKIIVRV